MSATRAAGIVQNTPEWLAFRLDHIGGSDAPVFAGEKPGLLGLVAEKARLAPARVIDPDTQILMDLGHLLEAPLMALYPRLSGREGNRLHGAYLSSEWPVASASPDGEAKRQKLGDRRGVQIKQSASPKWPIALEQGDLVPGDVFAQVQHEMYVMEWDVADVLVLLYGRPKVIEVPRDDDYIRGLLHFEREGWRYVETQTLPEPDGSEETTEAWKRIHPRGDGPLVKATPEIATLARQLAQAKADRAEAEGLEKSIANALRFLIGDAAGVEGLFTLRNNADGHTTDWEAIAREAGVTPELIEKHTKTVPGPRVLRAIKAKGEAA